MNCKSDNNSIILYIVIEYLILRSSNNIIFTEYNNLKIRPFCTLNQKITMTVTKSNFWVSNYQMLKYQFTGLVILRIYKYYRFQSNLPQLTY